MHLLQRRSSFTVTSAGFPVTVPNVSVMESLTAQRRRTISAIESVVALPNINSLPKPLSVSHVSGSLTDTLITELPLSFHRKQELPNCSSQALHSTAHYKTIKHCIDGYNKHFSKKKKIVKQRMYAMATSSKFELVTGLCAFICLSTFFLLDLFHSLPSLILSTNTSNVSSSLVPFFHWHELLWLRSNEWKIVFVVEVIFNIFFFIEWIIRSCLYGSLAFKDSFHIFDIISIILCLFLNVTKGPLFIPTSITEPESSLQRLPTIMLVLRLATVFDHLRHCHSIPYFHITRKSNIPFESSVEKIVDVLMATAKNVRLDYRTRKELLWAAETLISGNFYEPSGIAISTLSSSNSYSKDITEGWLKSASTFRASHPRSQSLKEIVPLPHDPYGYDGSLPPMNYSALSSTDLKRQHSNTTISSHADILKTQLLTNTHKKRRFSLSLSVLSRTPQNTFQQINNIFDHSHAIHHHDANSLNTKKQNQQLLQEHKRIYTSHNSIAQCSTVCNQHIPLFYKSHDKKTIQILAKITDWNFPILELNKTTNGNALLTIMNASTEQLNLKDLLKYDEIKFLKLIYQIQIGYPVSNYYHNQIHAADVAQTSFWFITTGKLWKIANLLPVHQFAFLFAAAIHDYDHPGRNNIFLKQTHHPLALRYNDQSILEHHHCACTFELLKKQEYNCLEHLSPDLYRVMRQTTISSVLATDMSFHFTNIGKFKARQKCLQLLYQNCEDRQLLLDVCLHAADISNPGKPLSLAIHWTDKIMQEFFEQGDEERALGLEISTFYDRYSTNIAKCQLGFIEVIVSPLYEAIRVTLPAVEECIMRIRQNKLFWENQIEFMDGEMKAGSQKVPDCSWLLTNIQMLNKKRNDCRSFSLRSERQYNVHLPRKRTASIAALQEYFIQELFHSEDIYC